MMKGIYKFFWDCNRMGVLEGIFVETADNVANLYGKTIYFGEVLGKYSDISGTIDLGDVNLITQDETVVQLFEKYQLETGYNPFYYLPEYGE